MVAGPIAILAAAGAIWIWVGADSPGVNETSFFRIRVGMTEAEVETILGGPPDVAEDLKPDADPSIILPAAFWKRGHTRISVYFNQESRTVHIATLSEPEREGLRIDDDERTVNDPYWRLRRLWKRLVSVSQSG
jgi:hypothetical protein